MPNLPKSPSLEVISKEADSSAASSEAERRRMLRINLSTEQFRLNSTGKIFSVVDLSREGMAIRLIDPEDSHLFPIATEVDGLLNLRGRKQAIRAKVRHLRADRVGCQFQDLDRETHALIESFLDPATLGREIKPIPASEPSTLWYHGPSGTDLLFSRGVDGQYRRVTLYVQGVFVQWDVEGGLVTGTWTPSNQTGEVWGVMRLETQILERDGAPDSAKLKIAKALLLGSNLPQDLKKWCLRRFEP